MSSSSDVSVLIKRVEKAEIQVDDLYKELATLEKANKGQKVVQDGEIPQELLKLRAENAKLNYRLNILKTATQNASKTPKKMASGSVLNDLIGVFSAAVESAFPDVADFPCPVTASNKGGDYQFNGAMALSGILKSQHGVKMAPRQIAEKILEKVESDVLIEKTEIAGPGFVNIFIKKNYVEKALQNVLVVGVKPPPVGKLRHPLY